jgi:hypothetical protein
MKKRKVIVLAYTVFSIDHLEKQNMSKQIVVIYNLKIKVVLMTIINNMYYLLF